MSRDLIPASEYQSPFVMDLSKEKAYFCYQYAATGQNPQLAAENCGISMTMARKWLREPMVKKAVQDIVAKCMSQCELHTEDIINELKRIAFFDIKGLVDKIDRKGPKGVNFNDVDGRAVSEIRVTESKLGKTVTMMKPHRKLDALKILLEHATGANNNQFNVQVNVGDIKKEDPESAMEAYNRVMEGGTLEGDDAS